MGKSKTKSTTVIPPQTADEKALVQKALQMANLQIEQVKQQGVLQTQQNELFQQNLPGLTGDLADLESASKGGGLNELLQSEIERFKKGELATPEQLAHLDTIIKMSQQAGEIDINRAQTEGLDQINQEIAPALGMRPGDTPILDRSGKVAAEALRQKGQLSAGLQAQRSNAILNMPTQRLGQLDLLGNMQQNRAALAELAFLNRLRLTGQIGQQGLGLATGIPANIGGTLSTLGGIRTAGATQTNSSSPSALSLGIGALGGVGGLLTGVSGFL